MPRITPEYTSDKFELRRISDHILYVKYFVGHVSRSLIEEVARAGFEVMEPHKVGVVSDFRDQELSMSTNAQKFVANDAMLNNRVVAQALLADRFSTSLKVGFFLNQHTTKTKMKAFHDYDDGLEWLTSLNYR